MVAQAIAIQADLHQNSLMTLLMVSLYWFVLCTIVKQQVYQSQPVSRGLPHESVALHIYNSYHGDSTDTQYNNNTKISKL